MTHSDFQDNEGPIALLAEDDSLIRELVSIYLENQGFRVFEARNGKQAIDLIENAVTGFDLIVTDVLMPRVNGDVVLKLARERGVCDRFLVMSGNPIDAKRDPQFFRPDTRFIEKPFSFSDFQSKVDSFLGEPVAQRT